MLENSRHFRAFTMSGPFENYTPLQAIPTPDATGIIIGMFLGIAIIAIVIGLMIRRYPEAVIERISKREGIDLLELGGGMREAIRNANREELIRGMLKASNSHRNELTKMDIVSLAVSEIAPERVVEEAMKQQGPYQQQEILSRHLSNDQLVSMLDNRGIWPDPLEDLVEIEDDPSKCYAWILSGDASEEDGASLAREIENSFIESRGKEPSAIHLVVRDIDEISQLDERTVRSYIKPWLKDDNEDKEANE